MTTLYQIEVECPSRLVNGPDQGTYSHTLVIGAYVDEYHGNREVLLTAVHLAMKPLYGSDWLAKDFIAKCRYKLLSTPLKLASGTSLLGTSLLGTYSNFDAMCSDVIPSIKRTALLEEKAVLEKRLKAINEVIGEE